MYFQKYIRISFFLFISTVLICLFSPALSAQETRQEIPHESGLFYTIQKGDTLWDLSNRFFDSPFEWPDLWNQNNQIPNPHWIYPGERIRLYHRAGTQQIQEQIKIIQKVEKEVQASEPPPEKEPPYYYYSPIESIGFIRKPPVIAKGTIFRVNEDKTLISTGDEVYIRPAVQASLQRGEKYTVYRLVEGARSRIYSELIAPYGAQHYLTGIVEIVSSDADYVIARVTRSFRSIRVNDLLMPYMPRSPKITLTESKAGISGSIITDEDRDRMFGDNMIAFIDKGKSDGIEVGQFYSVYYTDRHGPSLLQSNMSSTATDIPRDDNIITPIDFATVLVLHTEEKASTVLVTYAEKDLYPTARIRTPAKQ